MSPEVAAAVDRLAAEGVIPSDVALRLSRAARGELVSIRPELRTILWGGISLVAAGAGLFVREHYRQIGPAAILAALTLAVAACASYLVRRAAPFAWVRVAPPTFAFDYVLLLGVLLLGTDLAYAEVQFRLLGPNWEWHLLLYAIVALAAAYRWDSTAVLSLALSSFAAWRGVSVRDPAAVLFGARPAAAIRGNAIFCGALFLLAAAETARSGDKAHFEPVWGNFGVLLLLGGLLSGALGPGAWLAWEAPLLAVAAGILVAALRMKRESYAAEAIVAGYVGAMRIVLQPLRDPRAILTAVAFSGAGVVVILVRLHAAMRARRAA